MSEPDFSGIPARARELGLPERANAACLRFLKNTRPLPGDRDPEAFEMRFKSLGFIFAHAFLPKPFFETRLLLFYEGDEVGTYKLATSLEGEDLDDYLVLHEH
ncbi:hypothetical protein [Rhodocaloribacter sp.]